jgi:hypothetical protein
VSASGALWSSRGRPTIHANARSRSQCHSAGIGLHGFLQQVALSTGAKVMGARKEELPDQAPLTAILRYQFH